MNDYQKQFLKLYEPVHESFARFCHANAYGLMEAEDLISESILVALERFDTLLNKEAFLSFLFSTASNICKNKNRRLKFRGKYNEQHLHLIQDDGIDPEVRLDITVLYDAMNQLSHLQKEAIVLFEISGFSIKEIAVIQSSKQAAVKQRLKRGRDKLAELFKSDQLRGESLQKRSTVLMSIFL